MSEHRTLILHVIGARPHFMKLAPVFHTTKRDAALQQVIVHTGQHYDAELSADFLQEFDLPEPDINLTVGSDRPLLQIAEILRGLDSALRQFQPGIVCVYGDTNSTAAGAIAAAKSNVRLAHIEAGLREFDKSIPEEVNKLLTDSVSDLYFCPTETAVRQLAREGVTRHVYMTGDPVIDWIHMNREKVRQAAPILDTLGLQQGAYYFATCHRAANTDSQAHLEEIFSAFGHINMPVVIALHPRTAAALRSHGLEHLLDRRNITVTRPLGFWDTQALISNAHGVLTDSGGVIKEACFHQTPSVILDRQTEWVEAVKDGWATIAGPYRKAIVEQAHTMASPTKEPGALVQPGASRRILEHLKHYLNA